MPKHLFNLNVVLGAIAAGLAAYIAWEVVRPGAPVASSARPKSGAPTAVATLPPPPPAEPASSWTVISSRNPFSPSRSDAPATATQLGAAAAAANIPKPNLYGIVLKDGAPFAYIEDPQTKRVAAYRIGDAVAGGTLDKIARDGIVLNRPDGILDVRLHDPNKPRPALPSPPAAAAPGGAPAQMPGVIPPAAAQQQQQPPPAEAAPPPQPPAAAQSGEQQQTPPTAQRPPVRRPLPPNLLRRLPQAPPQGDDQSR